MTAVVLEDAETEVKTNVTNVLILNKLEKVEQLYKKALEDDGTLPDTAIECKKILDEALTRLAIKGDRIESANELRTIDMQSMLLNKYKKLDIEEIQSVVKEETDNLNNNIKDMLAVVSKKQADVMTEVMKSVETKFGDVVKTMKDVQDKGNIEDDSIINIKEEDFSPNYETSDDESNVEKETSDLELKERIKKDINVSSEVSDGDISSEESFDEEQCRLQIKEKILKEEKEKKQKLQKQKDLKEMEKKKIREDMLKKQELQKQKEKKIAKDKKYRKENLIKQIEKQEREKLGLEIRENKSNGESNERKMTGNKAGKDETRKRCRRTERSPSSSPSSSTCSPSRSRSKVSSGGMKKNRRVAFEGVGSD